MLTQQFFTRVQLAKILNFKNDNSIRDLERKGFLTPQIKPSKYTLNQVLFMMIFKEIADFTDLSWKIFIEYDLHKIILEENLIDYNVLYLSHFGNTKRVLIDVVNDDAVAKYLNDYFDSDLLNSLSKLKKSENNTYEDRPNFHTSYDRDCIFLTFSIDRIYRKLEYKCIELEIDLKEKVHV